MLKTYVFIMFLLMIAAPSSPAQEFWFRPGSVPISPDPLAIRPGKIGIGVPTAQWNNFNNATGNYTFTNDIRFLVQEDNIGHLERGTFGGTGSGDLWSAYGGPFEGFFPNFYGLKFQWGPYAVNYQLQARGTSNFDNQVKDAQIAWNSGNGTAPGRGRLDIGNLDANNQFNTRMSFLDNGNVGIGTTSPTDRLEIVGGDLRIGNQNFLKLGSSGSRIGNVITQVRIFPSNDSRFLRVENSNLNGNNVRISSSESLQLGAAGSFTGIQINPGPNPTTLTFRAINITGDSNIELRSNVIDLGTPVARPRSLSVGGTDLGASNRPFDDVWADNFFNVSDIREKENIQPLTLGLDHLMKLNPVSYQWKNRDDKKIQYGLIAQEVQEVIPEAVYGPTNEIEYDDEGRVIPADPEARMGIAYNKLIPTLIKSIQELNAKVAKQEEIIAALTGETGETTARLSGTDEGLTDENLAAKGIKLYQNFPNPFDQATEIRYYLPEGAASASLFVYDIQGNEVKRMVLNTTGEASVTLDGGALQAGVYFYTIFANGEVGEIKRMVLTR